MSEPESTTTVNMPVRKNRRAFTITELTQEYPISRATVYREAKDGRLKLTKIRGRTVVTVEDANAWWSSLGEV